MRPSRELKVRLHGPDGAWIVAAVDIQVAYTSLNGDSRQARGRSWADDENFVFLGVPAAVVHVTASARGFEPAAVDHDVRAGDCVLQLQPSDPP